MVVAGALAMRPEYISCSLGRNFSHRPLPGLNSQASNCRLIEEDVVFLLVDGVHPFIAAATVHHGDQCLYAT